MSLFQILLKARAQKKKRNQNGIPSQVVALLLSHKGQEWLDIPSGLDLDPEIIFFLEMLI